ncbi:mitochondrial carrier [Russula earlei]|uniref:Mitochondrial carrier n=1 Tax=Russula earlei TaxID=71964 RepID=A0ACC0UDK9_9AGAM|nr:mitochondrial carrier [Russula earlei]
MSVQSKQASPRQLTPLGYALAGALGGCFSNAVKTRIQADSTNGRSVRALLRRIVKEEGIAGLYRGFGATMLNTFSMQYAYFFFYSFVRTSYLKRLAARRPPGSPALALGAIAGALAQIFTIPVSVIATRQQLGSGEDGTKEEEHDGSFWTVAREIVQEEGVTGLWLGLRPGLVLTVNPAITYGVFERMKGAVLAARERAGNANTYKSLATVVTYPYIMAKVRIQTRKKDAERNEDDTLPRPEHGSAGHRQNEGAVEILGRVLRTEGFLGWYKGMGAQILKAVLSQGVLFMSKEQFEQYALAIMVLYYRISASSR